MQLSENDKNFIKNNGTPKL